jgi:hypothetical protein
MNREQAKEILALYRPGTADAEDPSFSEARRLCGQDPELNRWFEQHCARYLALRARFKQVAIPAGLKEQILAERKIHTTPAWRRPAVLLTAMAVVAVIAGGVTLWQRPRENLGFSGYINRMAGIARRGYAMELETKDPAQVRAYLTTNRAPSDYVLPHALEQSTLAGCAVKDWQGAKVSMICFYSGRPLPPGETTDLWFFVIDHSSVQGAPASSLPAVTAMDGAAAASWTVGNKTYVLVAEGDEQFLRKYL